MDSEYTNGRCERVDMYRLKILVKADIYLVSHLRSRVLQIQVNSDLRYVFQCYKLCYLKFSEKPMHVASISL